MSQAQSFENLMQELETVVERLESDDLSLEDAIDAYQRGVKLAKDGHDRLQDAQQRIEEVTRGGRTREVPAEAILGDSES